MSRSPSVQPRVWPYLTVGAVCGLTWATALRGWMEQLAVGSGTGSTFTWLTEALLLLPATLVGLLLGRAAHHRACGTRSRRALIWTPALLATAIADPALFKALITTGEGGGSLIVVITALSGGFTLSRRRWSIVRALTATLAVLGLLLITGIGSMAAPMQTPRGAWVCLLGFSLVLLLSLAAVLPYPPAHPAPGPWAFIGLGGLAGFAWAGALRSVMADLAGIDSVVHAADTFGYVLLPGATAGALLGWAEYLRRTGDHPRRWLLVLAPFTLWAVVLRDLIERPQQGVDVGPLLASVLAVLGAWALSARGPRWTRLVSGVLFAVALWPWIPTTGGAGPDFALTTPHGLWAYLAGAGMLVLLALATTAPLRRPSAQHSRRPAKTNAGLDSAQECPASPGLHSEASAPAAPELVAPRQLGIGTAGSSTRAAWSAGPES
jgi:hypothetical protein